MVAILMGGIPVIVDVDPVSYCINFDKIPNDCRVIFVSAIGGRYPKYVENRIKSLREAGKIVIEDLHKHWVVEQKMIFTGTMR